MATRMEKLPFACSNFHSGIPLRSAFLRLLSSLALFLCFVSPTSAQTSSQQYVYVSAPNSPSSTIPALAKISQTGALNPIPSSPFNERLEGGLLAIDGQGKFLFVLNPTSDDISMFHIDQATGTLSEVPSSPFAVPPVPPNPAFSQPISLTGEPTGKYMFVGYFYGSSSQYSALASLAVDTSGSSPVLTTIQTLGLLPAAPIKLFADSKGLHLYAGMGIGPSGTPLSGAQEYSITTGNLVDLGLTAVTAINFGVDYAIDPQDRFIFVLGGSSDHLASCVISPVDGTATTCGSPFPLGFAENGEMVVESSGHFLYIPDSVQSVVAYSVDQTTGDATQVASLPGIVLPKGSSVADPTGPYIYSADSAGSVHAYLVDHQTGSLTEIPGSPFTAGVPACCQGLAITGNPVQSISGPAATLFPSSASNFAATAGSSSATQIFSLINTGNQLLAINSISLAGPDASSFSETNTCLATLAPNAHCSISITFNPSAAGTFTATLQVADNAPGSPQTLALNGTGVAPAPSVTFSPPALSFPSTNQGSSSAPQMLTVISSGNTALNVSSVSLSGPNPLDFSLTNNCTAPLAPGSNCIISLVFTPTSAGQRVADLMIADDASGSPQTVALSGTGIAVLPALTFSPSSPSFPSTTQGTSSAPQSVSVINSGNASLQISSVSLSGSSAAEFNLSSNCAASLAPAASCTVSLIFSPLATGQSVAMLTITDDAPGSPQSAPISGTAVAAFSIAPASGSSTTASVSAGRTAQYQLQLTPGAGFTGTVSLSCSGAPLGAVCQVPASVSLAGGAATFNVTVTTSGPAQLPPSAPLRIPPFSRVPLSVPTFFALLFLLLAFFSRNAGAFQPVARKSSQAPCGVLFAAIFCILFAAAGCGGGNAAMTTPPPVITPSGTSTITISLSATSSTGQPLQLQPIQLTLTVK